METTRSGWRAVLDVALIAAFLAGLVAPALRQLGGSDEEAVLREQRTAADRPELSFDVEALTAFPSAFERWYADTFGFRPQLIRWHNRVLYSVFGLSPTSEMARGRGDWFFTTVADSIPVWRGRKPFRPVELDVWRELLTDRTAWCAELGASYLFVIAPNKSTIYPERMAARIQPMGRTRMDQLAEHLAARPDAPPLFDLRGVLRAAKERFGGDPIYFPLGTHWNKRGGVVAAHAILSELALGVPGLEPWPVEGFTFHESDRQGDSWAARMYLEDVLTQVNVDWTFPRAPRARQVAHPYSKQVDILVTEIDDPSLPTAVVLHDSFGKMLRPLFAEHFRRCVQYWTSEFPDEVVEAERPDVVIHVMTERGLVAVRPIETPLDTPERLGAEFAAARDAVLLRIDPRKGGRRIEPFGSLRRAGEAPADAVARFVQTGPDGGFYLPDLDVPDDRWAVVKIALTVEEETRLWLEFLTETERDEYTRRGRGVVRALEPGRNAVWIKLRVPDLTGRLLVRPAQKRNAFVLHGVEVRAVPR